MNILILNWRDPKNPKSGGAEKVTLEHARAWVRAGHKVIWFASQFKGSKKEEIIEGVNIIRSGNSLSVYILAPIFYLSNKNKFDLVIDEVHGIPFFTPLYVRVTRIVLIHEVAGPIWDYMFPFPFNFLGKALEPFYLKVYKKEKFWVPSQSTVDDLMEYGISKKNITKIYCSIDNPVLIEPSKKEEIPTFIFVSRVVKMKGVEEVIKSFYYILKELKDGRLWIVGDGDKNYLKYLNGVMRDYSISTKVKFLGKVSESEKLKLMRRAHLILHASVKEGWGLVIVEAASQSTPAIVYNVGGLRDSVLNNKTGVVISDNSPTQMANAAIKLLKDKKKYKTFQNNCLAWARSLSWDKSTKESLSLINKFV